MENLTTTQQTIQAEVQYAGFWLRVVASLVDSLITQVACAIILVPLFVFGGLFSFAKFNGDIGRLDNSNRVPEDLLPFIIAIVGGIILVVIFIVMMTWLYYALMESSSKQATLGKMILNLKITDLNGGRISFARASGRFFGKFISSMTFYIGYIMAGLSTKKQALHDMMADCLVVKS